MKEISIFIRTDDLAQVTEILRKHNVGGISFYEIMVLVEQNKRLTQKKCTPR